LIKHRETDIPAFADPIDSIDLLLFIRSDSPDGEVDLLARLQPGEDRACDSGEENEWGDSTDVEFHADHETYFVGKSNFGKLRNDSQFPDRHRGRQGILR
jgi:hypothetical protein